jgi:hypothetical protein
MRQLFLRATVGLAAFLSVWSIFKVASLITHAGQWFLATKPGQTFWKLRSLACLLLGAWLLEVPPLFGGGAYTPIPRVQSSRLVAACCIHFRAACATTTTNTTTTTLVANFEALKAMFPGISSEMTGV